MGKAFAWIAANKLVAAVAAFVIVVGAIAFVALNDGEDVARIATPEQGAEVSTPPATGLVTASPTARKRGSSAVVGTEDVEDQVLPGVNEEGEARQCTARDVDEIGVSKTTITIGQIVTDSTQIPQQFRPAHEGLQAFVKLYNSSGGLCGRKLVLEYRNDNLNPAIHSQDMRDLANRVLAFVGNESLLDQLDYEQDPPFQPTVRGGGSFVPDVGGLAFSYARSQSAWHAGVVGSVSPVLVGGGQYKFFINDAKKKGRPCRKAGVVYLQEPTGASEDQARIGQVSLEEDWGGDLGSGNTQLYPTSLLDSVPAYEALVNRMVADGMNCVFTYTDLQSSINLVRAMNNRGVWPPAKCQLGETCFRVTHIPLSAYDQKFIQDGGDGARDVSTFIPHTPLSETSTPAMKIYLNALKGVPGARPSTFSIFGFASGVMFVEALQTCAAAPTRSCLMTSLRKMTNFTAGGLLGGTTPFRKTRASYDRYGTFDWKWIFNQTVALRVGNRGGKRDFYRMNPKSGFLDDSLKVARGEPA